MVVDHHDNLVFFHSDQTSLEFTSPLKRGAQAQADVGSYKLPELIQLIKGAIQPWR